MTTITVEIPFLSLTGKPALKVEVDASIETRFHLRAAITKAVSNGANLRGADLRSADLRSADLGGANLRSADLGGADLGGADLGGADLRSADLGGADLGGADLRGADLRGADLRSADLGGADLRSADLGGADLRSAVSGELAQAMTSITPDGAFVGWKKCQNGVIVAMLIPGNAKRSNATGRKCRAEYVEVLEVIGADAGVARHDGKTTYRKGDTVRCDAWCEDRFQECAGGIHFFLTRIEAENY